MLQVINNFLAAIKCFLFFLKPKHTHTHICSHTASADSMSRSHSNQQRNLSLLELHSSTPSSQHTRYPGSQSNRVRAFSLKTHCSEGVAKYVLLFHTVVKASTFSLSRAAHIIQDMERSCCFLNTLGLSLKISNSRFKLRSTF